MPILLLFIPAICGLVSRLHGGVSLPSEIETLFDQHCYECHDGDVSKGGLNLEELGINFQDRNTFKTWVRILDRVEEGEMPPPKKPRPKPATIHAFQSKLQSALFEADRRQKLQSGSVHVRRLTRKEFEYTVHDLLAIDITLLDLLPEDTASHGFETVADSQQISHFNLASYLDAADLALEEAFKRAFTKPKPYKKHFTPEQLTKRGGGNYRGPEARGKEIIAYKLRVQFYGRMYPTRVPESGWYKVTLHNVRGVNPGANKVVWGTLRSGANSSAAPMMYPIGLVEASKQKRDLTFDAWIQKGHSLELKVNDATVKTASNGARGGNVSYQGRDLIKQGYPGIATSGITMERIYSKRDPEEIKARLLAGFPESTLKTLDTLEKKKNFLYQAVGRFANVAFRRPVTLEQAQPYIQLAYKELDRPNATIQDALKAAYRAILCSPRFHTFVEKPGQLDDHALASRLSYTLWNSMPDWQLRQLADQGKLKDPKVYHAQIERLLAHPFAERFITSFTDQWLNLKDINFTTPDTRLYRSFDPIVQESMLAETRAYFREILQSNLRIRNIVSSDFSLLNERLARFYNLKGLELKPGQGLQKVKLVNSGRGGIVTHGSILKVTANGTTTSPVVRGVWVSEKILGMEIPAPPDNVPAVEPDIRGAKSIRDQLDKHRNSESCAGCHRKIDPAGLALENYDPVGLWRGQYGTGKKAAKVNPAGKTPEGQPFANMSQWKKIYSGKQDMLTRAFAKHLLTYATGAHPRFSDRQILDKIVSQAQKEEFKLRNILHATLTSETFQTK